MRQKTYKKSSAFWKHGKHKPLLPVIIQQEREKLQKPKEKMYETVQGAFQAERKKKKRS
jgi:hypothetical protein